MIIIKLMGCFGNQMFQYAAAKRLAVRRGTSLKLDVSVYRTELKGSTPIRFELDRFNMKYQTAKWKDLFLAMESEGLRSRVKKIIIPNKYRIKKIREDHFGFDRSLLEAPDNVYLIGDWQSENYFKDIEGMIRKDYLFRSPQKGRNRELADLIASTESVGLHIRRGDYVSDPMINMIHGTCDLGYYSSAIKEIVKRTKSPYFLVFSDDIQWAKDNLKIDHPVIFVDNNSGRDGFEDMRLMSQCKHNIIANSSFSWWAAWLNKNPEKIVIAPKNWFKNKDADTRDLFPEGWVKI
jgi:hypothetical protein